MTALLVALAGLWLLLALHDLRAVVSLPQLPQLSDGGKRHDVTIVMAVRDDGEHIEESVRRLLAQRDVDLRLVVIDDRSTDATGVVLARLATGEPRLRVVTIAELPPDWLGKTHALHRGSEGITTRWILFTDGDAHLAPDTLARAIDAAERTAAAHVCLLPEHRGASFLGRACLLAFQLAVQRRVAAVNADHRAAFVGTGAFNLVRTDAYRAIGGHLPLRLEVVDDVWLGCLLRRAGHRCRVWLAANEFAIEWGATPRALVKVVEKNMFAVLRYRTWLAAAAVLGGAGLLGLTFAAPWYAGALGWLPLGCYLATGLAGVLLAHRLRWPLAAALLTPATRGLLLVAMANSTWVTLRQGGVRWRGTFYPLEQLRRGQVH
ncbi:MAG: glycosyltransferase [Planctomycetes bacterium]|jgi:GT2 family glycosyltransferase|nr:glycosyltransferase [Planctomycetota bacterium]